MRVVTTVVLGAVLLSGAGCAGRTSTAAPAFAPAPSASVDASEPTPAPPPSATRTSSRPTPRPTQSRRPTPTQKPVIPLPPPPPAPTSGPNCPSYSGPKAPVADVKAALTTAATTAWWVGAVKPKEYTGDGSEIVVPVNLMKAVAWQESGWQSTIIACDGGIGTMQVMPGTATFMNDRFGRSHNVNTLSGNTALGATYLEWLMMYFGLYYFGSFDLSVTAPVGANGATMRLRDVVLSAYNVGPGAVEGKDSAGKWYLEIPNWRYVNNVVALSTNCVCLTY